MKKFLQGLAIVAGIGLVVGLVLFSKEVNKPILNDDLDSSVDVDNDDAADSKNIDESVNEGESEEKGKFTPGWRDGLH